MNRSLRGAREPRKVRHGNGPVEFAAAAEVRRYLIRSVTIPVGGTITVTGEVEFLGAVPTMVAQQAPGPDGQAREVLARGFEVIFASPVPLEPEPPQLPKEPKQ